MAMGNFRSIILTATLSSICMMTFINSLPNNKTLDLPKFKAFAEKHIKYY